MLITAGLDLYKAVKAAVAETPIPVQPMRAMRTEPQAQIPAAKNGVRCGTLTKRCILPSVLKAR